MNALRLARTACSFPGYVRTPVTRDRAIEAIRARMDNREANFLRHAHDLIYAHPGSPYRRLLLWAGCGYEDLEQSVRTRGIEGTLAKLRDAGVYLGSDLAEIIGGLIQSAGGCPDDFQFWESQDGAGLSRLVIVVSPRVPNLREEAFAAAVLRQLQEKDPAGSLTSTLWGQAGTIQIVRADPALTGGHKLLPIVAMAS